MVCESRWIDGVCGGRFLVVWMAGREKRDLAKLSGIVGWAVSIGVAFSGYCRFVWFGLGSW